MDTLRYCLLSVWFQLTISSSSVAGWMSTFEVCAFLFFPLLILKNHSLFLISNTLVWQINYWLHVKFVCSYDTAVLCFAGPKVRRQQAPKHHLHNRQL